MGALTKIYHSGEVKKGEKERQWKGGQRVKKRKVQEFLSPKTKIESLDKENKKNHWIIRAASSLGFTIWPVLTVLAEC